MTTSDWIALGSSALSFVGVLISGGALWYTHQQWIKVKSKIGMIEDHGQASDVLPAWYTGRMMTDRWLFGLYTNDGRVILIRKILAISDDGKWMDVELVDTETGEEYEKLLPGVISAIANDRPRASIQIANIVIALDLQTS